MLNFGVIGYGLAGLFFLVLTVLLVTSWRGRLLGGLMVTACLLSSVWGFVLAWQAADPESLSAWVFALEVLRDAAWITFLLKLVVGPDGKGIPRWAFWSVHGIWITVLIVDVTALVPGSWGATAAGGRFVILGGLVLAVLGLVLVEQLYRNAEPRQRWALKFLPLAIGGIFAYDLFLYAHGLLFRGIDADLWHARGLANALVVPMLAVAARRNPEWSLDVFVSRNVVFYSASLVAVGVYLLAMALGGYYIKVYGGSWGAAVQAVFLFGAGLLLLVIVSSGEARGRLRVFLTKHFYRHKYEYRDEWNRLIDTLFTADSEGDFRGATVRAMAQIVGSGGGVLWEQRGSESAWYPVERWHSPPPEPGFLDMDDPLPRFLDQRGWIVDTAELDRIPERYGDLTMPPNMREAGVDWLIVPLRRGDRLHGFMQLKNPAAGQRLNFEDIDLLKTVGRQVAGYLALHEAMEMLAESRQFETFNRLTAFIMHDLKNLIAQQSLVVENAARFRDRPEFIDDAITTIANSVERMSRLMEELQRGPGNVGARRVDLREVVGAAVAKAANRAPVPAADLCDERVDVVAEADRLSMIIGHVIRNAQEATDRDGRVDVDLRVEDDSARLVVTDTGLGMSPEFVRDRLFRPFHSTKGKRGMGIGAYQVREFVAGCGGRVEVDSKPGKARGSPCTCRSPPPARWIRTCRREG